MRLHNTNDIVIEDLNAVLNGTILEITPEEPTNDFSNNEVSNECRGNKREEEDKIEMKRTIKEIKTSVCS